MGNLQSTSHSTPANEAPSVFSLTDVWGLGLDPGGSHAGSKPAATRMGDVRLAHLFPHLPDALVVLRVWILQKI